MKVTIDLENLESLVKETTENNIETIIKEQVKKSVNKTIEELAKKEINNAVSSNFQKFVDEYIKNTVIKVGGNSYWDDEEQKEYTVEQYIKKELKDRLESKTLKAKKKGRKFMDGIRKDINKTMKDTFDSSTKNMLSSAVLSILTANDTYRQIENQIKCIADKRV